MRNRSGESIRENFVLETEMLLNDKQKIPRKKEHRSLNWQIIRLLEVEERSEIVHNGTDHRPGEKWWFGMV